MGFVKLVPPPKTTCRCQKPLSHGLKNFGVGTIWQCDACGRAWEFVKRESSQRDGDWDVWQPRPEHDGPDRRPIPAAYTPQGRD